MNPIADRPSCPGAGSPCAFSDSVAVRIIEYLNKRIGNCQKENRLSHFH